MKLLYLFSIVIFLLASCSKSNSNPSNNNNGGSSGNNSGTKTLRANGNIRTLAIDAAGNIYAAGDFKNDSGYNYVAKWNGNSWSELGNGSGVLNSTNYLSGIISTSPITVARDGFIVKWNGNTWSKIDNSPYFNSIAADLVNNVYTAEPKNNFWSYFVSKWNGTNWSNLPKLVLDPGNSIESLVCDASGNLYAGCTYASYTGIPYVMKWNRSTWSYLGGKQEYFSYNPTNFLYFDQSNNLYAGVGYGSSAGYLAKWNGSSWSKIGSVASTTYPTSKFISLTSDKNGNLFGSVQYSDEAYSKIIQRVVKWDGSNWVELAGGNSKLNANGPILALATDASGNVYAAGGFTNYPEGYRYVAKWNGSGWSELRK